MPLIPLILTFEHCIESLGEGVLINVELVVQLRIRVASDSLVSLEAINDGAAISVVPDEWIVGAAVILKVLELSLQFLLIWLISAVSLLATNSVCTSL